MFDIDRLVFTSVPNRIYSSTGDWVVSQNARQMQVSDCSGKVKHIFPTPDDAAGCEFVETSEQFVFVFSGRTMIAISKLTGETKSHSINLSKVGKCITPLAAVGSNVVFGTKGVNRTQLVLYDPWKEMRVFQTASWKLDEITDFYCVNGNTIAVLNNTLLVNVDMNTGESKFTRFESGRINKSVKPHNGGILYPIQGLLTFFKPPDATRITIPGQRVGTLFDIIDNRVICSSHDQMELICFDLPLKTLAWKTPSSSVIRDVIAIKTTDGPALVVRLDGYLTIVEFQTGVILRSEKVESSHIRLTGKNLILSKNNSSIVLEDS